MNVIRDELWERCLNDAVKMYRISEPNDACYKLANATWVMKKKYQEAAQKKESQKVIVLDKKPDVVHHMRNVKKVCCATTMTGKPCSFKAVCGDFCKKHSVKGVAIGDKVDFSKIKIAS